MININFLSMYDLCKTMRTASDCQEYVVSAAPAAIRTYLTAYDVCSKTFGREVCMKRMSPEAQASSGAFVWGLVLGVLGTMIIRR